MTPIYHDWGHACTDRRRSGPSVAGDADLAPRLRDALLAGLALRHRDGAVAVSHDADEEGLLGRGHDLALFLGAEGVPGVEGVDDTVAGVDAAGGRGALHGHVFLLRCVGCWWPVP